MPINSSCSSSLFFFNRNERRKLMMDVIGDDDDDDDYLTCHVVVVVYFQLVILMMRESIFVKSLSLSLSSFQFFVAVVVEDCFLFRFLKYINNNNKNFRFQVSSAFIVTATKNIYIIYRERKR